MPRSDATNRVKRMPIGFSSLMCNGSSPTVATSGTNIGISGASAFSIAGYAYINNLSGTQTVFSIGSAAGSGTGISLRTSTNTWNLNIQGIGTVPGVTTIVPNQINEFVVTYAGGSAPFIISLNGVVINGSGSITMNTTNSLLYMGRDYSSSNALTGGISDVRVWNVALSVNDIATMYATREVPTTGLIRRYKLNEGTGSSIADSSVNNDTGTVSNPYWSQNNVPYGLPVLPVAKPSQLPKCLFYYEADQGVTLDGSNKVSQWDDLSGNGTHMTQATSSLRFTYTASSINGYPTVNLVSGTGNIMTAAVNYFANQPHTLVVVAKSSNTQPTLFSGIIALGSGGAGGQTSSIGTDNGRKLWFGGAGDGTPTFNVPTTGTTYMLAKLTDGKNTTSFINHVSQGVTKQLVTFSVSPLSLAVIGQYSAGSDSGNWNVALIAGFAKELLPAELNALANYVNDKYAIGMTVGKRVATSGRSLIT